MLSWLYIMIERLHTWRPYLYWFLMLAVTIIGAFIISIVIGITEQKGLIPKFLWLFRIPANHPQPTAWDYFFSKGQIAWVIVTLVDGSKVYGKYSSNSFSSSDNLERDLYIEETYHLDSNNKWVLDIDSLGVLIVKDQIRTVEFYNNGGIKQ